MSRVLIASIATDSLITKHNLSQAGINFCKNFYSVGCFDKIVSPAFLSVKSNIGDEVQKEFSYVKYIENIIHPRNYILKIINLIIINILVAFKSISFDQIWYYNLHSANAISYIILKFIFRKKVFILVADRSTPKGKLSISYVIQVLINKSNGVISLSSRTNLKLNNIKYLPGIINCNSIDTNINDELFEKRKYLFSGTICKETGIYLAIDAFIKLPTEHLYISGSYKDDNILRLIEKYNNIHYLGYLSFDNYNDMLKSVFCCLSLRDPSVPENINNFPSKILEYINMNKLVISTIYYPELRDLKYILSDFNSGNLVNIITNIKENQIFYINNYLMQSNKLREYFSNESWFDSIVQIENNM